MDTIQPRPQEKSESIEQYLEYFADVIEVNEWNDSKAAAVFRAMLPHASDTRALLTGLTEAQRSSFVAINAAISEARKPLRDSKVMELYSLQRRPGQKLEDLAARVLKLVEEVYPSVAKATKMMLQRDRFLTALNPELKAALCNSQNSLKTVSDIKNLALAIETSSRMLVKPKNTAIVHNNNQPKQSTKKWCKKCRSGTHNTEECRKATKSVIASIKINGIKPAKRQFINLVVGNKPLMGLIDTGSQVSTVPAERTVKKSSHYQATAINGSGIEIIGSTRIPVSFNGDTVEHNFLIADLDTPIIGRDFLLKIKGNVRHDNWLDYSLNNKPRSCPLVLEDQSSKMREELSQVIGSVVVDDLSITSDPPTDTSAQPHPKLTTILEHYDDVFEGIGYTELTEHRIELKEDTIINSKPFPVPHAYREEVRKMIKDMLDQGIIEPSKSEWSSPMVVVKKKDESLRIAIDYRKINAISKTDAFPTPRIDEIINGLHNAQWFTKLDFRSGYYQIPMRKSDRDKTAFQFDNQQYQFKRMPFGLSTAMQTFMRLISQVLQFDFVRVYVDDVTIFSSSLEEHFEHLQTVLNAIRKAGLTLNRKKCDFMKQSIEYLGFIIGHNSIKPSQEKIKCIINYPTPKSKKELKSFLGLVNSYRALIEEYAERTADMYHLLKKDKRFVWSEGNDQQFKALKALMTSNPVVRMPDFSRKFIVRTDASDRAMAGILQQMDDSGNRYVVEYFSKKFSDCQSRYATIEKEATALKSAIDKWSIYLRGKSFLLETDHRPLVWLKSMANRNNKLARMALELAEYDFEVVHVKGKENCDADALSRIELAAIAFDELESEQETDSKLQAQRVKSPNSFVLKNNLLYFKQENNSLRLCIPQSRVKDILRACHDQLSHIGQAKTLDIIWNRFYWPNWRNDTKQFIRKCHCNVKKSSSELSHAPLQPTEIHNLHIFERVAIDIMTIHASSNGYKYIFTLQDYKSKWIEAQPSREATSSSIISWLEGVWAMFGKPKELWTDKGSQFESKIFQQYCEQQKINIHHTTAYHHQSNGMVERTHRTLWDLFRATVNEQYDDWDQQLPKALWAYRISLHQAIGSSPYEIMFGRQPELDCDHEFPTITNKRAVPAAQEQQYQQAMKHQYDIRNKVINKPLTVGTHVIVNHPTIRTGRCQKLLPQHKGPLIVSKILGPTSYELIDNEGNTTKAHRDQIKETDIDRIGKVRRRGRPSGEVI